MQLWALVEGRGVGGSCSFLKDESQVISFQIGIQDQKMCLMLLFS